MTLYISYCKFCKTPYTSTRIHSKYCSTNCRVTVSRIKQNFEILEEMIPYKDAVIKSLNLPPSTLIYIKDYYIYYPDERLDKHYADIYVAPYSYELRVQMTNRRIKIQHIIASQVRTASPDLATSLKPVADKNEDSKEIKGKTEPKTPDRLKSSNARISKDEEPSTLSPKIVKILKRLGIR